MKSQEFIIEEEGTTKFYHVTLTKHIPKIMKEGILPLKTSNWIQAKNGERYGGGYIFSFGQKLDAIRWAAKWDWEISKSIGSGKVSIVEFVDSISNWQVDKADPLSQIGRSGDWLKKAGSVKPSQILNTYPVDQQLSKQGILR